MEFGHLTDGGVVPVTSIDTNAVQTEKIRDILESINNRVPNTYSSE